MERVYFAICQLEHASQTVAEVIPIEIFSPDTHTDGTHLLF